MTLAIASVAVIMFACKKEGEPQADNGKPTELTIPQDNEALARLMQFRKQEQLYRENPAMKSGETLTIDEALLNITDLFNATYTEPEAYYSETMQHEFCLTLDLRSDNMVLLTDVLSAYEQAVATAREAYVASGLSEKGYISLIVDAGEIQGGKLQLNFSGHFGEMGISPNNVVFEDAWGYSAQWAPGKCVYDPTSMDSGADKELERFLDYEKARRAPVAPTDCRNVYIENNVLEFRGNNSEFPGIFYRPDDSETCIEADEMNELYAAEANCIFHIGIRKIDPTPPQQQNYSYYVTGISISGGPDTNGGITHYNRIIYGKKLCVIQNDFPLERLGN